MSNCNNASTSIVKYLYLALANIDFIPDLKDVSAYKQFIKSV